MTTGIVFDIKEFTIHDGPGIRTTVFLKGCPLSCSWCHNPEGQLMQTQVIRGLSGERLAGQKYTALGLATILNQQVDILRSNGGGITFSGGEPLMQAEFVAEVIDMLHDVHILLDTCGFGNSRNFCSLIDRSDLVFFDLKLIDRTAHQRYTGCDNEIILENLQVLSASSKRFVIRVPLIPGVTDTNQNLKSIAETVRGLSGLVRVDLLPYNKADGSKYKFAGMEFKPDYDETQPLNFNTLPFEQSGVKVCIE